ncbi:hypothetical protein GCM10007394_04700 [Salinibacterium amurskyense]|nr:hypothetical protein GCM10007394_04700 [Salinibacterium amurskyense]
MVRVDVRRGMAKPERSEAAASGADAAEAAVPDGALEPPIGVVESAAGASANDARSSSTSVSERSAVDVAPAAGISTDVGESAVEESTFEEVTGEEEEVEEVMYPR